MSQYILPEFEKTGFHCPHCGVLSHQQWKSMAETGPYRYIEQLKLARCTNEECNNYSLWLFGVMIYPKKLTAPIAHEKMPEDVCEIYNEARKVSTSSKRAAAALLRVALEKLTVHLGESKGKLNTRIGNLYKKGLPKEVIDSLDIVRINANEGGVHAGEIDLSGNDTDKVVNKLFWLVNFIVEKTIADQEEIQEMFDDLPEEKKAGIKNRDGGS